MPCRTSRSSRAAAKAVSIEHGLEVSSQHLPLTLLSVISSRCMKNGWLKLKTAFIDVNFLVIIFANFDYNLPIVFLNVCCKLKIKRILMHCSCSSCQSFVTSKVSLK